jgi:uncharacterized membrane protein YfcA
MPVVTATLALIIFVAGAASGSLGALLGLGGGVFLVPFLNLGLGFPFSVAAAISLTTVIATSSSVSASRTGQQLINMKLGMLLEVATAAGSFLGGVTAQLIAQSVLQKLFGVVAAIVALIMLTRLRRRNVILDPSVDPGVLGGRYYEHESGAIVTYRVKRLPVAVAASFVAGNVSALLGIGGGIIKVPLMHVALGVPLRISTATSNLMVGITASTSAIVYLLRGGIDAYAAGPTAVGVFIGASLGSRLGHRVNVPLLRLLFVAVLLYTAFQMARRAFGL